jgi:hypothetical protein
MFSGRVVRLEPAQADLLTRICAGALITAEALAAAGAVAPSHKGSSGSAKKANQDDLFHVGLSVADVGGDAAQIDST